MKTKEIKKSLEDLGLILGTSEGIKEAAEKVVEMAAHGVRNFKSYGLQPFFIRVLKRVHVGAAIPEILLKFSASPEAAVAISLVPIKQQQKLVSYPYVNLTRKAGSNFTYSVESIYDLTAIEIQQIFGGGTVRSTGEQEDVLSNPDVDATVKGDTRTINMHFSHADFAVIEKAVFNGGFSTKCAYLRAVMRGETPPPLKMSK